MLDVPVLLVGLARGEQPLGAAAEHPVWPLTVEQCESKAVDPPRIGRTGAVVEHEPTSVGEQRWRRCADAVGVPGSAVACAKQHAMVAPVAKVG